MLLLDILEIDRGLSTSISVDTTDVDFSGIVKVVFAIKNSLSSPTPVVTREYTTPGEINEIITPEESVLINDHAYYDFTYETIDGKTFRLTDTGRVKVNKSAGVIDNV